MFIAVETWAQARASVCRPVGRGAAWIAHAGPSGENPCRFGGDRLQLTVGDSQPKSSAARLSHHSFLAGFQGAGIVHRRPGMNLEASALQGGVDLRSSESGLAGLPGESREGLGATAVGEQCEFEMRSNARAEPFSHDSRPQKLAQGATGREDMPPASPA